MIRAQRRTCGEVSNSAARELYQQLSEQHRAIAQELRETARGLWRWCGSAPSRGCGGGYMSSHERDGEVNPWHAAKRLERIAAGLDGK